jgi:hypothetical protein
MNKKLLISLIALASLAMLVSTAKAQITCTIQVKDVNGNTISGGTVPMNTVAYVYGNYSDLDGTASAQAWIDVYYDNGTGLVYQTTIFNGTVQDGQTAQGTYTLSKLGSYEFRFTCQADGATGLLQCGERTQARTTIQLVVPEPATIATLIMALSAFGFLAYRKSHAK